MKGYTNSKGNLLNEIVSISITGVDNPTFTVSYNGTTTTYTGNITLFIPDSVEYTITFNKVDKYITPESVTYTATKGNQRNVNVEYIYNPIVDLSLYDVYGNPIQRSTANCYVIKEPGQYKFPLVYGNAIKNGKVNTAAFTNNGGTYSHDFVNGAGGVITGPTTSTGSDTEIYPTGSIFQIVNSDCEDGVITNINEIQEDGLNYYEFTVNEVPATGGNIIFQAYGNAHDMCIWTWHIWLWPHDLSPIEITNYTGVKYNIMPVNLASKYDNDNIHIKNWFYQWGRPNPMLLPSAWNSTTDHTPGSITKASKASSLATGLSFSSTFYKNSTSPYNWFGTKSYYNLWDASCTTTGASDNDTVKTVYDPCPVGWKVPNGEVFSGFNKIIKSANGKVYLPRYQNDTVGVEIPLSGFRNGTSGALTNVSDEAELLTSAAEDSKYIIGRWISGSDNMSNQVAWERCDGCSIRPVEDDNIQLDVIMISFTIQGQSYQAESGMTWFEWVNSEYNTGFDTGTSLIPLSIFYDGSVGYVSTYDQTYLMLGGSVALISKNIIGGSNYAFGIP